MLFLNQKSSTVASRACKFLVLVILPSAFASGKNVFFQFFLQSPAVQFSVLCTINDSPCGSSHSHFLLPLALCLFLSFLLTLAFPAFRPFVLPLKIPSVVSFLPIFVPLVPQPCCQSRVPSFRSRSLSFTLCYAPLQHLCQPRRFPVSRPSTPSRSPETSSDDFAFCSAFASLTHRAF